MKKLFVSLMLFAVNVSCAQKVNWREVILDSKSAFTIKNEGKHYNGLFEVTETSGIIKADILVNSDTSRRIMFTKGEMNTDTLKIVIHQTDPAYHHQYVILIVKDRYTMDYRFSTSGEEVIRRLLPIETNLRLNSLNFRKGEELRGYAEYKAKCVEGCWEDTIVVKGNFVVTVN